MRTDRLALAMVGLCGAACSAVAGDDCANPTPVFADVAVSGDTDSATASSGIASDHCGGSSEDGPDVWYTFTAESAGSYIFSLCGSSYDTVISLWDACPEAGGSNLDCNDDNCLDLESKLTYSLFEGQTVLVRIGGYDGETGSFTLLVGTVPANDECGNATEIQDGDSQPFNNLAATHSGLEISCGLPDTIYSDLYYSYTATCTGDVTVATCGTDFDTVVAVFDACGGAQVACNDDGCDTGSEVASSLTFSATAGVTYIVAVGSYFDDEAGAGYLSISCSGTTPTCPADFNGDGFMDFFDYDDYVNCFETGNCPAGRTADFNGDEFVDFFDYDDFVSAFETGC